MSNKLRRCEYRPFIRVCIIFILFTIVSFITRPHCLRSAAARRFQFIYFIPNNKEPPTVLSSPSLPVPSIPLVLSPPAVYTSDHSYPSPLRIKQKTLLLSDVPFLCGMNARSGINLRPLVTDDVPADTRAIRPPGPVRNVGFVFCPATGPNPLC